MIDLSPHHLETVKRILDEHVPGCEVKAFGSRATWTATDYSDLDLLVLGQSEVAGATLSRLNEAFEESDLPMRVDVVDWHGISPAFRKLIEPSCVRLPMAAGADWSQTPFGDCALLVGDKVDPASCGDMPYIGLEHIGQGTLSLLGNGTAADVESTKTVFRAGDILFGKLRPYFRKVVRPDFDGICSTDIWAVRPKAGVDARFLFYLMASEAFVDFASQGSEGTRMPRAKWEHAARYVVHHPPMAEQCAIAHVLGALDDKIALNHRMVETLEQAFIALFNSWFAVPADTDLPDGWSVRSLDEIAHFQNGLALQKYRPLEGEERLPVLKIAELRKGTTGGKEYASADIPSECIVENGDLIFSWSGSLMAKIWCGGRAALNQHLFKVTSSDLPDWLVFGWLSRHMSEFQFIAADKATTMGHIRRHHLQDAQCVLPNDDVMETTNRVCGAIHKRCIAARVESGRLADMRDMLLSRLISGEIRVPEAEKLAEVAT